MLLKGLIGKAVAEDTIANEFLKSLRTVTRNTICHLFNECLRLGTYPWNTSIVTPLHKKGGLYDPDNYRAIAVASNSHDRLAKRGPEQQQQITVLSSP